jgi:hypothetical protein
MDSWTQPFDDGELTQAQRQAVTALNTLARLGRSDQADAILEDVTSGISYDGIINNPELSDDGKRRALATKYMSVMNTLARRLDATAQTFGRQDAADTAAVLGIANLPGDVASLSISRRDASDRVSDQNDTVSLQRLLEQVTRTGDEVLARAVAEQALTLGDADTLNAFTADRPQLADAVERLWNAQQRKTSQLDLKVQWWLGSLKPALLSNLQNFEIESAAAGKASVGQWKRLTT